MNADQRRVREIFLEAVEIPSSDARATFLDRECADDEDVKQRVQQLIHAHERSESLLDNAALEQAGDRLSATIDMREPVTERPGTRIGPYKLREQLGEGGFGVVYVAEQKQPVARKVALKIIKPGMDTKEVIARFEAERQALALMDHPNIAKVLDAGTTGELRNAECGMRIPPTDAACGLADNPQSEIPNPQSGRPYFVMELVRGVPITEFCDAQKLSTRDRLALFVDVCRAVQHAHQKGIIHRDLKPSNILVTMRDDRPIPKVIDFGVSKALSRQLTEKTVYTAYGQMIGTPLYMSPEQAQLNETDVDTRSDVYSLGVLLYELLTGTTPFDREKLRQAGFDELRRIIREEEPPRPSARISTLQAEAASTVADKRKFDPRKLSRSLRGELDWIVMKALEKDRNRRYESASAFAADVERYLAHEPIHARPPSPWLWLAKWARRHPTTVTTALACLLLAAVGSAVAAGLIWSENQRTQQALGDKSTALAEKNDALNQKQAALKEKNDALAREQAQAYRHRVGLAAHAVYRNDVQQAKKLLAECPRELRHFGWHYLNRLCRSELLAVKHGIRGGFRELSVGVDRVSVVGGTGQIGTWDLSIPESSRLPAAGGENIWEAAAFGPDGKTLAVVQHYKLTVRDAATGRILKRFDAPGHEYRWAVAFLADDKIAVRSMKRGTEQSAHGIDIWDTKRQRLMRSVSTTDGRDRQLIADNSGRWLFVVGEKDLHRYDVSPTAPQDAEPAKIPGHRVAFHPDGKHMAVAVSKPNVIRIMQVADGKVAQTISGELGRVNDLAFSPDGKRLAAGSDDQVVRVWDVKTLQLQSVYRGHFEAVRRVAFNRDGTRIVSLGETELKVWDATRDQQFLGIPANAAGVDFAPNGRFVAIAWMTLRASVCDADTGKQKWSRMLAHESSVWDVAVSPDSLLVATGGFEDDNTVKIWSAATGKLLHTLKGHANGVQSVAFSPKGDLLASAGIDRTIHLWNPHSGKLVRVLKGHSRSIAGVVFSPDGRFLASLAGGQNIVHSLPNEGKPNDRGQPREIRLWEVEDGDVLFNDNVPLLQAFQPAFSPDGNTLAVPCHDGKVRLYGVPSGLLQGTLSDIGHAQCVAYTPDGKRLAVGWTDGRISLWDPVAREKVVDLRAHRQQVWSLAFSGDGQRLVSCSMADRVVKIWDATPLPDVSQPSDTP